jgi:hypothetical protein
MGTCTMLSWSDGMDLPCEFDLRERYNLGNRSALSVGGTLLARDPFLYMQHVLLPTQDRYERRKKEDIEFFNKTGRKTSFLTSIGKVHGRPDDASCVVAYRIITSQESKRIGPI